MDVLAVDELGCLNIKPEQTNIFFKLMEERHHRRPTPLTTNLPYAARQDFLGNRALTQALLSRLRERCHAVIIDGACLRPQQG
jgi:DNA replication protein DnaC